MEKTTSNRQLLSLLFVVLFLVISTITACRRNRPISNGSHRQATGIAEADSLILEFDFQRGQLDGYANIDKNIVDEFCKIAEAHPENEVLKMRKTLLVGYRLMGSEPAKGYDYLSREMAALDSAASPYDWYCLRSLRLAQEKSIFAKYMQANENIDYFKKAGAEVDMARNLVFKGNALIELSDKKGALECLDQAEKIFLENNYPEALYHVKLNKILLYEGDVQEKAIEELLNDSLVKQSPSFYSTILQNSFYFNDSVELLDKAIELMRNEKIDRTSMPVALSMKACMLVYSDREAEAFDMIKEIREAEADYKPYTRDRPIIHNNLAMIFEANEMPDSCIAELVQTIEWSDSLQAESNYKEVYASEAGRRIEETLINSRLRRRNMLLGWVASIIFVTCAAGIVYLRQRRKAELRQSEMRLLDEKIKNEQNINFAQSSILEESERLVGDINLALESLSSRQMLSTEARKEISRIISVYKSNDENRAGFLKINREVDSDFARKLKADFPDLVESQIRLAALIAAGVDSRQLSAILNISSKSVYTSRYRLRTRLGLSKDESLEDFLRRYA